MKYLEAILNRLRKPSVVLSLTSQIITILLILRINVDKNMVVGVVTIACSILVTLGIMSDPTTKNKWYLDDVRTCSNCKEKTAHTLVNGKMVCKGCGAVNDDEE